MVQTEFLFERVWSTLQTSKRFEYVCYLFSRRNNFWADQVLEGIRFVLFISVFVPKKNSKRYGTARVGSFLFLFESSLPLYIGGGTCETSKTSIS